MKLNSIGITTALVLLICLFATVCIADDIENVPIVGKTNLLGGGTILTQIPHSYFTHMYSEMNTINGHVTYDYSVGSKRAIEKLVMREFKYAGVEFAPTDAQYATTKDLQMIPFMVAPIAIIFNLGNNNGSSSADSSFTLSLDKSTLVAIFDGSIKKWNDDRIVALNQNVKLPDEPIRRVVRQDKSGATYLLTSYFSAIDQKWNTTVGASSDPIWPNKDHYVVYAETPSGLSRKVFTTPYSIGYAALKEATADEHNVVALMNDFGNIIKPSIAGAASAVNDYKEVEFDGKMTKSLMNGHGDKTWPIVGYSYLLFRRESMKDCKEANLLLQYFSWLYTSKTVNDILTENLFLPLDDASRKLALDKVQHLKCNGGYVYGPYQKHLRNGGIAFGFFLLLLVIIGVITAIIYAIKFGIQYVFEKSFYGGRISA